MRGLDRTRTAAPAAATASRGAFAAVAAVAALLLSIATLAAAPRAGFAQLAGQRIAFLADAADCAAPETANPTPSGAVPACAAERRAAPHATLAARAAVMLRHTSLPPPARA